MEETQDPARWRRLKTLQNGGGLGRRKMEEAQDAARWRRLSTLQDGGGSGRHKMEEAQDLESWQINKWILNPEMAEAQDATRRRRT